jgi:hypothetical protein
MYNTNIGKFCAEHDNWEEVLSAEPYYLKIKRDTQYIMFSYDQIRSDFNIDIVQEARGIIFREGVWKNPVCWAFNKFGNYGESYAPELDWSTAYVTEKVDGSLIKVWYDLSERKWHISTNGTIDAFKAELGDCRMTNFGDYFLQALEQYTPAHVFRTAFHEFTANLDEQLTYMFELVGPYNRVVVPYDEPDLYFLGARNKFTGEEYLPNAKNMADLGVPLFNRPKVYQLSSLADCIKVTEEFNWDQEGFVVADAGFNRVKIKSPSYVMAHFMRNNNVINKKHLIRVILDNEIEEFLCYAGEYKEALEACRELMTLYHMLGNYLSKVVQKARPMARKDYAELVKTLPAIYHGLLYINYEKDFTTEEFTSKWNENKWEACVTEMEQLKNEFKF